MSYQLELTSNEKYLLLMALARLDYETFHAFKLEAAAERHLLLARVAKLGEPTSPAVPGEQQALESHQLGPITGDPRHTAGAAGTGSAGTESARAILSPPPKTIMAKKTGAAFTPLVLELSKVNAPSKTGTGKVRTIVQGTDALGATWQASVWDPDLFPHVANRVKQKTKFFVSRTGEGGKYLNIVGLEV